MRNFRLALVAGGVFIIGDLRAAPREGRTWFDRKDYAAEAAVRALVVASFASSKAELGQCIHDQYFGSPLAQRSVLSAAWRASGGEALRAMLGTLQRLCAEKQLPLGQSDGDLWARTGTEAVLLELEDAKVESAKVAASVFESLAVQNGQNGLATCIDQQMRAGAISRLADTKREQPITIVVHDFLREQCGLNGEKSPAARLPLPAMPDLLAVARERLLIVQDFRDCEVSASKDIEECHRDRYRARAKALWGPRLLKDAASGQNWQRVTKSQ